MKNILVIKTKNNKGDNLLVYTGTLNMSAGNCNITCT